ncbi:hypothetical protein P152DRAFT_451452 [Eremomyces bilateralis CBS 781.70]|uniref:Uncharacterized protein n=1 Tax=Eremomyces bilateralis CBS 781.70 TaxID=1392243 RepID=A0A6G1FWB5_9PEZI|nr:uncharacterized protein P152DRAFT_451452 [Eremomyces bilateralis CBS 781.70]KAF1810074.1 hypothetical protein P152DRAFT_451452 [Eremomyces bilateralis CBS 781.70]
MTRHLSLSCKGCPTDDHHRMAAGKRSREPEPDVPSKRLALDSEVAKSGNETPADSDVAMEPDVTVGNDASEAPESSEAPTAAPTIVTPTSRGGYRGRVRGSRGGRGRGRGRGGRWATRADAGHSTPAAGSTRSEVNGDDADQSTQPRNGDEDVDGVDDVAEEAGAEIVAQKRQGRGRLPGRRGRYGPEVAAAIIRAKELKGCFKAVASAMKPYLEELNKRALDELKQESEEARNRLEEMEATKEIQLYLSRRLDERVKEVEAMKQVKLKWAERKNEGEKYLIQEKWNRKLEAAEVDVIETVEGCLLAFAHSSTIRLSDRRVEEEDAATDDGRILPTEDERSLGARGLFKERLLSTKYTHSGSRTLKPNDLERFAADSRLKRGMDQQLDVLILDSDWVDSLLEPSWVYRRPFIPPKAPNNQTKNQIDPELLRAVYDAQDESVDENLEEQGLPEISTEEHGVVAEVDVGMKRRRTKGKKIATPTGKGKAKVGAETAPGSATDLADKSGPGPSSQPEGYYIAKSVEGDARESTESGDQLADRRHMEICAIIPNKSTDTHTGGEDVDREAAALNALMELKGQYTRVASQQIRVGHTEQLREARVGERKRSHSEQRDIEEKMEAERTSREFEEKMEAERQSRKEAEERERPSTRPRSATRGKKITDLLNAPHELESPILKSEPKQQPSMKQWRVEPTPTTIIHQGSIPVSTFSIRTEDGKYNSQNRENKQAGIATQTVFSLNPNDPSLERASEKATKRGKTFWQAISKGAHGATPPPPQSGRTSSPEKSGSAMSPFIPGPHGGYQFHVPGAPPPPPNAPGAFPPPPPGYSYALPPPPGHPHHLSPPPPSPQTPYWRFPPPNTGPPPPPTPYWIQYPPPPLPSQYSTSPTAAPPQTQGSPNPPAAGPVSIAPHPPPTPTAPHPPQSPYNGPQYGGPTILPAPIHHHHTQQMQNHHHHTIPSQLPLAPAPPERPPTHPPPSHPPSASSAPGIAPSPGSGIPPSPGSGIAPSPVSGIAPSPVAGITPTPVSGIPGIAPSPISGAPAFAQGGVSITPAWESRRRQAGAKRGRARREELAAVMRERGETVATEGGGVRRDGGSGRGGGPGSRGPRRGRGARGSMGEVTRFKSYEPPVAKE